MITSFWKRFVNNYIFLSEAGKQISQKLSNNSFKLTNADIRTLFSVSPTCVAQYLKKVKKENEGKIKENRKPFIITKEELNEVGTLLEEHQEPQINSTKNFLCINFH